jgi:tetratricopeptide (TPR) repeat protein
MAADQEAFNRALQKGHSAAWKMNWKEAVQQYQQALYHFPGHVMALSALAMSLIELKDYENALSNYREAVRIAPQDPILMENTARLLDYLNRTAEAAEAYARAAELYIQIRELPKAAANLERLITIQSGNLRARSRLAQIYEHQGKGQQAVNELLITAGIVQSSNPDKARQVVEYALHILPDNKEAINALETIRVGKKLPGRVEKPFIEEIILGSEPLFPALEKDGREPEADPIQTARQLAISRLAEEVIDFKPGESAGSADQDSQEKAMRHANAAVETYTQGQINQTIIELEDAFKAGLDSTPAWFLAGSLQSSFQPVRALTYLEKSESSLEYALASFLSEGMIYQASGKLPEAQEKLLKAFILADMTTVPPDRRELLEGMYDPIMEVHKNQGDENTKKNTCEIITSQLMRPDWKAYFTAARSHMPVQMGNHAPLPLADILLVAGTRRMVEGIARARNLTGQGMYNAALDALYYELKLEPDFLPAHEMIADLLFHKKQVNEAVTKYLLVEKLYELRGEVNQAIRLMLRVEQMVPASLEIRNRLIELYFHLGRVDEAIQHYLDLADMYYHMADLDKARQTYLSVMRLSQKSRQNRAWTGKILHKIADIDMQRLEWREAIRILEQIRTMIPEDEKARASLVELNFRLGQDDAALAELDSAVAFFEKNQQVSRAVEFIVNAIIQRPEKRDLRSRLLVLSNRIGDVTSIVENIDHKAESLLEAGNKPGAVSLLEAIISLYPPNVEEYKKVLDNVKTGG